MLNSSTDGAAGGFDVVHAADRRDSALDYESRSRVVSAAIDPEQVLQLDDDRANNRLTDSSPERDTSMWALRWAVWLQDAVLSYGWAF